jgi:heat shock protein HtpX
MGLLLSLCGWVVAGTEGLLWTLFFGGGAVIFGPPVSPELTLRLYGARRLGPADAPELYRVFARISERAGLPRVPSLYYVPSGMLNAFALGSRDQFAICLTDGLLRHLTLRELAGVLAHEASHIRNNDLWVMSLADVISRLTGTMSMVGVLLLALNLPLLMMQRATVPWLLIALLLFAPTLAGLLQLGLSRTREYDADLEAAALTGDPRGLASALTKLERFQGGLLETLFLPGRRVPDPSLLRTHPPTRERIARLLSLEQRESDFIRGQHLDQRSFHVPSRIVPNARPPRWHRTGVWY